MAAVLWLTRLAFVAFDVLLGVLFVTTNTDHCARVFEMKVGHALLGHVMSTTVVVDEFECQQKCLGNNSCKSFNVHPGADNTKHICELNNKTRKMRPSDFKKKKVATYYGLVKVSCFDVSNSRDPESHIPPAWPKGTYGLPMPKLGCPQGSGFTWLEGTRYQDTEDPPNADNSWSSPYDLAGHTHINNMEQKFCIKTQSQTTELSWPKGQYCVFKKWNCPTGLTEGWIYWDDENNRNSNSDSGTLPDGDYGRDTKIIFCCRSDGFATDAIILPTDSPFVLFRVGSLCQYVQGMNMRDEYFVWDTEDDNNKDSASGSRPYGAMRASRIKLHYCYYYR